MKTKNFVKKLVCLIVTICCTFAIASSASIVNAATLFGDSNNDGAIDCKDVLLMRQYLYDNQTQINIDTSDINEDGVVDVKDVLLLRRALANLIIINEEVPSTTIVQGDPLAENIKTVGQTMKSPISDDEYTLMWIDDFNGNTLNESDWTYYTRNYNSAEESVNRKENVEVKNGFLNIYAKKEKQVYTGGAESWETAKQSNLTSGAINTQGKKSFKYGRIEIKCKIPYSYGMWAAFWTMGVQRGWPWCGENDIMEFVGGTAWGNDRDNEYLSNLHWSDPDLSTEYAWSTSTSVDPLDTQETEDLTLKKKLGCGYTFKPQISGKLNDEWHVCGVEWTENYMIYYFDNIPYFKIDISRNSMRLAFHQPHYLILNLVMGGSWAGTPNENTVFPQKLSVDWVKVWQK